jgi:C4-dicarboxylate-binding protein DctP
VKTRLFESGSLFPDLQVAKALVQGQVEMCCPGTWTITGLVPNADFSELPAFYGRPLGIIRKATDAKVGKLVAAEIESKLHVRVMGGWLDLGFYNWFSTRKRLTSLADIKGMKIRSPGGVLISWRVNYFGGLPNVTAWPDVPLAMSQGTFDGLISSNESCNSAKLYDSGLRYSLQDRQAIALYVPLVNEAFWAKLSPKLQETVLKLWAENLPTYRDSALKSQARAREELASHNVAFVDVPQAELDQVRATMLAGQDKAAAAAHISENVVKQVMADIGV